MDRAIEDTKKFTLCVLPTQVGKTFTAIRKIDIEIDHDQSFGRSVHLVNTMNILLSNKQFAKRLEHIENTYGKNSVCIFASKYEGKYKHVTTRVELQGLCLDISTCPRVIVMCSNKHRYDDSIEFIKVINNNTTLIKRAFIYYDELHKYISTSLRKQIEEIHDLDIVKNITALTATPDKIWEESGFWSNLRLIELPDLADSNYVGFNDMKFTLVDDFFIKYSQTNSCDNTSNLIKYVLDTYPEIIGNNTRTFIPAHKKCISHIEVRKLIFRLNNNAIVVLINGIEKTIQYQNKQTGQTETLQLVSKDVKDEEVCETIARLIITHNLQNRPLVITGFLCVSMGQTLTHKSLGSFTSAIFGQLDLTNDEIYQLFGRVTGRMKDWGDKYNQTHIYCTTNIKDRCNVMERCARNIVNEHNGEIVTQEDYREPMYTMGDIGESAITNLRNKKIPKVNVDDTDKKSKAFDYQCDAILYAEYKFGIKLSNRPHNDAPKTLRVSGRNPSKAELLKRMWGLSEKNPCRMVPMRNEKWLLYWRPSLVEI